MLTETQARQALNNDKTQKSKKELNNYAKYSNIAFQMLAVILLGVFGGVKLDKLLALHFPVFTVILSILSVFIAIYIVIKDLLK